MQIECRHDRDSRSEPVADAPQNLSIRIGEVASRGSSMQSEQQAVNRAGRFNCIQQFAGELFKGLRG